MNNKEVSPTFDNTKTNIVSTVIPEMEDQALQVRKKAMYHENETKRRKPDRVEENLRSDRRRVSFPSPSPFILL